MRAQLIDAFIKTYADWRQGCDDLQRANQRSTGSALVDRDLAFTAYRAALDREEEAALVHELRTHQFDRPGDAEGAFSMIDR